MKQKIKDFFITLWYYVTFPYHWLATRKIRKELTRIAAKERAKISLGKDIDFKKAMNSNETIET